MAGIDTEWQVVGAKKGKKIKRATARIPTGLKQKVDSAKAVHALLHRDGTDLNLAVTDEAVAALVQRVRDAAAVLEQSTQWTRTLSTIPCSEDISANNENGVENRLENGVENCLFNELVALGCGNFASQPEALLQAGFCLLLLESCVVPGGVCSVFDPVHTPLEQAAWKALGFLITENLHGKHVTPSAPPGRLLVFMPHCPVSLYGNFIWANWERLDRVCIIGNSFEGISLKRAFVGANVHTNTDTGSLSHAGNCVGLVAAYTTEKLLPAAQRGMARQAGILSHWERAFADTATMTFVVPCGADVGRPTEEELMQWNVLNDPEVDSGS